VRAVFSWSYQALSPEAARLQAQTNPHSTAQWRVNGPVSDNPDFAEAVRNVYAHADSLYEKVDTLLDYESARVRLDKLELEPLSGEGS